MRQFLGLIVIILSLISGPYLFGNEIFLSKDIFRGRVASVDTNNKSVWVKSNQAQALKDNAIIYVHGVNGETKAILKVTQFKPRFIRAKVIDGSTSGIKAGYKVNNVYRWDAYHYLVEVHYEKGTRKITFQDDLIIDSRITTSSLFGRKSNVIDGTQIKSIKLKGRGGKVLIKRFVLRNGTSINAEASSLTSLQQYDNKNVNFKVPGVGNIRLTSSDIVSIKVIKRLDGALKIVSLHYSKGESALPKENGDKYTVTFRFLNYELGLHALEDKLSKETDSEQIKSIINYIKKYDERVIKGVGVAGSFNNWDDSKSPMKKTRQGLYEAKVTLSKGTYQYYFVIHLSGSDKLTLKVLDPYSNRSRGNDESIGGGGAGDDDVVGGDDDGDSGKNNAKKAGDDDAVGDDDDAVGDDDDAVGDDDDTVGDDDDDGGKADEDAPLGEDVPGDDKRKPGQDGELSGGDTEGDELGDDDDAIGDDDDDDDAIGDDDDDDDDAFGDDGNGDGGTSEGINGQVSIVEIPGVQFAHKGGANQPTATSKGGKLPYDPKALKVEENSIKSRVGDGLGSVVIGGIRYYKVRFKFNQLRRVRTEIKRAVNREASKDNPNNQKIAYYQSILAKYKESNVKGVSVTGTFNNWKTGDYPLKRGANGVWEAELYISEGKHQYKYAIETGIQGEKPFLLVDHQAKNKETDSEGSEVGVLYTGVTPPNEKKEDPANTKEETDDDIEGDDDDDLGDDDDDTGDDGSGDDDDDEMDGIE
ncbi:MAG: hypothetical protein IEMM0008_0777 [bacterium]|nr:MAG: hypothetical protein IEMM0008_0777 [bacterium]